MPGSARNGKHTGWAARLSALVCLCALALLGACSLRAPAPESAVVVEPRAVQFSPARTEATLTLRHVGPGEAVALSNFHIDTRSPDWGSFTIENESNPKGLQPGERAELRLRVHARSFRSGDAHAHGPRFHSGAARLRFREGDLRRVVELRFSDPDPAGARLSAAPRALLAAVFALLLALAIGPPLVLGSGRPDVRRVVGGAGLGLAALAVLAVVPFADGVCSELLATAVSDADVQQCRDGRAGVPLAALPVAHGLLVYLAALGLLAARGFYRGSDHDGPGDARRALATLTLIIALLGPVCAFASVDLHALVIAQGIHGWGVHAQPLAFAVALLAAAASARRGPAGPLFSRPEARAPASAALTRLLHASIIAPVFLAGWMVPGDAVDAHGVRSPGVAAALLLGTGLVIALARWAWSHRAARSADAPKRRAGRAYALATAIIAALFVASAIGLLVVTAGSGSTPIPLTHGAVTAVSVLVSGVKVALVWWALTAIDAWLDATPARSLLLPATLSWAGPIALANLVATALLSSGQVLP